MERTKATQMTVEQMLAGAKFYARASAVRAVHGHIPDWDDEADEANWERTRQDIRDGCLDMVRGIAVAAFFETRKDLAFARALQILGREPKAKVKRHGNSCARKAAQALIEHAEATLSIDELEAAIADRLASWLRPGIGPHYAAQAVLAQIARSLKIYSGNEP